MASLPHDLRTALRLLRRAPAFVAAVVLPLALALGANTALFTVVRGVLLRPLPWPEPDRLVRVYRGSVAAGIGNAPLSPLNYVEDIAPAASVASRAAWKLGSAALSGDGPAEHVRVGVATASLLPVLGVRPALGRWFEKEEESPGRAHRIVLSHALWSRRFGGDPGVLGRTLQLDGEPYEIVGVLPAGVRLPETCDAWTPLAFEPRELQPVSRNFHSLKVVARLAPGSTVETARRQLLEAARRTQADHPEAYSTPFAFLAPGYHEDEVRALRPTLVLLFGAVLLVLVMACANVGNLLLARATARERELAIRSAMGAGRAVLVRQLLAESLVLALLAGALGLALGAVGMRLLLGLAPDLVPRPESVRLDPLVMAFSLGLALLSGVGFGLVPALSASRLDLEETLRGSAAAKPGPRRLRRVLVMVDVALALVLLSGAALLLRSFAAAVGADPGFRADGVTAFTTTVPLPSRMTDADADARIRAYVDRALVELRALPGVRAASATTLPPMGGDATDRLFEIEGQPPVPGEEAKSDEFRRVTPGFFETLRIPLLRGRDVTPSDGPGAPPVLVVNQAFERRRFPEGALGKRIRMGQGPWATIVGVVGNVREFGLDQPEVPVMYWPAAQDPSPRMTFLVHAGPPFAQMSRQAVSALQALDSQTPVYDVRPYESAVAASVAERRFSLALIGSFGVIALVLAAVGLYGVVAYTVRQRTREIGVRMALGADSRRIARLVASESARMLGTGLVVGLVAALGLSRVLAGFLYGIGPTDPLALVGAAGVLGVAATLATLLPVRRATRVDPVVSLGAE